MYICLIASIVPKPNISYLLDADPVEAHARKPEYPLEFLHVNRKAYLTLSSLVGGMAVIAPMPAQAVKRAVMMHALNELPFGTFKTENGSNMGPEDYREDKTLLSRPQTRSAAS
jgi:hypothetical protein